MPKSFRLTVLMLLSSTLAACAALESVVQQPTVSVVSVAVRPGNLLEGVLDAQLEVHNPNGFSLPVKAIGYSLTLNNREFTTSTVKFDKSIPARGSARIDLPITLRYADLLDGVAQLLGGQTMAYQLSGQVDAGLISVPYRKAGEFILRR